MRRSEPITWDQVRVGVFLIVALAGLALGIFLVGRTGHVFGERYRLVTLMHSAAGLVPGAPVQVAGQSAGQVAGIEFIRPARRPATGQAVAVWLAVDLEVKELVRADSRARLRTQGLLGDRLIDIEPGTASARVLEEGDTIRAVEALDYQEALDQASDAITSLTGLVRNLTALTESMLAGEGTIGQMVTDDLLYEHLVQLSGTLDTFLVRVTSGEGFLGRMLEDEALYDRLASAAASLDSLASSAVAGEGSLGRLIRSDSLYTALLQVASRTDSLLQTMQEGEGALGKLMSEEELYEEVLRTLVELNSILEDLRSNPTKYIPPVKVF
ncbi:MAG: MlaD family protein [Gemmatimonadota bacterium]